MSLRSFISDPRTTVPGVVFFGLKGFAHIAVIWWPAKASQIKATADILEGLAVAFLGAAAADKGKSLSRTEADTAFLHKGDVKPEAKTDPAPVAPKP